MKKATLSRRLALDILLELEWGGMKADELIRNVLYKNEFPEQKDRAFMATLVRGCVEKQIYLDYVLNAIASKKTDKMKAPVRAILRMGAYQLLFMDHVTDAAACNEAVLLVNERHMQGLSGFVNGILRNLARNRDDILLPDKSDTAAYLSVEHAMPMELTKLFLERFGAEKTEVLFEAYGRMRPVSVRFLTKDENERKALLSAWKEKGVSAEQSPYLKDICYLRDVPGVESLDGYDEGLFIIQDVSSLLSAMAAGVKEGDTVIDMCAAPGGKTLYMAERAGEKGRVLAFDISESKTALIEENADRLGFANIETGVWDASVHKPQLDGTADVVMADLPCSGLGVLGRKCDIRHNVSTAQIEELAALQRQILGNAAAYLKRGGTLIFSTCTVSRRENEENSDHIEKELGLVPLGLKDVLPAQLAAFEEKEGRVQLLCGYPAGLPLLDSFYSAKYKKT